MSQMIRRCHKLNVPGMTTLSRCNSQASGQWYGQMTGQWQTLNTGHLITWQDCLKVHKCLKMCH